MTSLRQRLILGILAGITVILAANGLGIYWVVGRQLEAEMDQGLDSIARATANRIVLDLQRPEGSGNQLVLSGIKLLPFTNGPKEQSASESMKESQLIWDTMRTLTPYTESFTVSGLGAQGRRTVELIRLLGRSAIATAELTGNRFEDRAELQALITLCKQGAVDVAVVGNRPISSGAYRIDELAVLLEEVRDLIPETVDLATSEDRRLWLKAPELMKKVDRIHACYSPFDEGVAISNAVSQIACWHEELVVTARGRPVMADEVNWPWAGETVGNAMPTTENALRFLNEFATWAALNNVSYTYGPANAFDWNGSIGEPGATRRGLVDEEGELAFGAAALLDAGLGSPGPPTVEVIDVPTKGLDGYLLGRVRNVGTLDHTVVVYIRRDGAWWNKPSFASPITPILCDGTWAADVTTGLGDEYADRMTAFLMPGSYIPPFLEGELELPPELYSIALDIAEVTR